MIKQFTIEELFRGLFGLLIVGVILYLVVTGKAVDPQFNQILLVIFGFYFGGGEFGKAVSKFATRKVEEYQNGNAEYRNGIDRGSDRELENGQKSPTQDKGANPKGKTGWN